ncbi:AbgT family transporter [Bacteroidales bacterium OttesenSCG-928-K22]|nr:AbgT family transporter [Bacteroidales bacterium OttesenSCG-928-L14]MDL2240602.1 AbgT family transporter [Bacteroidales bacterium OttesenSCG-928-K22]
MKKVPHTYVIIFFIIIICSLLTLIIPAGEFNRQTAVMSDGSTREVVDPDSFHYVEQSPQLWEIFTSFAKGFVSQAPIIIFILLIGGAFWIMNATKALDIGIAAFLRTILKLEKYKFLRKIGVNNIILILIMIMFSLFGAIFGMSEETIAFIIIFVPLCISLGYDSIVGVCVVYVAAHLGFAGAILNPFTIGIAQGIAEIPLFSGIEYRMLCWLIINAVGFTFILLYANKVKKNPQKSPMYELDAYWRKNHDIKSEEIKYYTPRAAWFCWIFIIIVLTFLSFKYPVSTLTIGAKELTFHAIPILTGLFAISGFFGLRKSVHFFIIDLLLFTILFLILGVMGYGWYVIEIGSLFFAMGLLAGISAGNSPNSITKLFLEGAKDILSAAMVVGLAGGIIIILQDGKIIDTIMYSLSKTMNDVGKTWSLGIMYLIQTGLNLIMPSGSAKAALTMPLMIPFSDLLEISRQSTVLAFQFGDGFTNMITPTSGVLMGCLGMAKIPYEKWFKFFWKFILLLIIVGFILLIPTVFLELNGF